MGKAKGSGLDLRGYRWVFFLTGLILMAGSVRTQNQNKDPRVQLRQALRQVSDIAIRGDAGGLGAVQERLQGLLEQAEAAPGAHYGLAFLTIVGMQADPSNSQSLVKEGLEHAEKAIDLDPQLSEAYATGALLEFILASQIDKANAAEHMEKAIGFLDRGLKAAPGPRVGVMDALIRYAWDPNGPPRPEGVEKLEQAIAAFEKEHAAADRPLADWWHAYSHSLMGRVYMGKADPDYARGFASYRRALELRPDFDSLRSMLPTVDDLEPAPISEADGKEWTELATDPEGDGRIPNLADGKALSYRRDRESGVAWFKYDLYGEVNRRAFGVNLVVDADGDQSTGLPWWGRNAEFTYDRIYTVWLAELSPNKYSGTVGVGTSPRALTALGKNNIRFAFREDGRSIVIGISEADLPAGRWALLGAVGSNTVWNDDIKDAAPATLELP